jgi:hypothetical protein
MLLFLCLFLAIPGVITAADAGTRLGLEALAKRMGMDTVITNIFNASEGNFIGAAPRGGTNWTWAKNFDLVTSQGHQWCKLQRGNWSCVGAVYKNVLSKTTPYDARFSLSSLPKGSRLYFEGNSFLMEQVGAIVCNSRGAHMFHFHRKVDGNTNDWIIYDPLRNVSVLVIDNDKGLFARYSEIEGIVEKFRPDAIVLGVINYKDGVPPLRTRQALYSNSSKLNSTVLSWGAGLPGGCEADFHDCGQGAGHQCFPGPFFRVAEQLMRNIIEERWGAKV